MKSKIIYGLNILWTSIISFTFSFCFGLIFLDITGHSKGYAYDLGPEKDISIMSGCVELLIWLVVSLPSIIYAFKETSKKGKRYIMALIAWYMCLMVIGVYLMFGGWSVYIKEVFNV